MPLKYWAALICILFVGGRSIAVTSGNSTSNQVLSPSTITGAAVVSVTLDHPSETATIRVRNLSDRDITAFSLAIHTTFSGGNSSSSGRINDLLPGIRVGLKEGIHPGASYDDVVNAAKGKGASIINVTAELNAVVFNDATAEFSDREMLMQIVAERKATADAAREATQIIRTSSSKAEAMSRLVQAWEEARFQHSLTAPLLKDHIYNVKNGPGDSNDEQKLHMLEYADKTALEAEFFSLHANLHRRAQ